MHTKIYQWISLISLRIIEASAWISKRSIYCILICQVCSELDRRPPSAVRKGQPDDPVWQVCSHLPGDLEGSLQEGDASDRNQHDPDTLLPPRSSADSLKHPLRHRQGNLWTVFCFCRSLGLWGCHVSRPGELLVAVLLPTTATVFFSNL